MGRKEAGPRAQSHGFQSCPTSCVRVGTGPATLTLSFLLCELKWIQRSCEFSGEPAALRRLCSVQQSPGVQIEGMWEGEAWEWLTELTPRLVNSGRSWHQLMPSLEA